MFSSTSKNVLGCLVEVACLILVKLWKKRLKKKKKKNLKENLGGKHLSSVPGSQMKCRSAELYINFYANLQINSF